MTFQYSTFLIIYLVLLLYCIAPFWKPVWYWHCFACNKSVFLISVQNMYIFFCSSIRIIIHLFVCLQFKFSDIWGIKYVYLLEYYLLTKKTNSKIKFLYHRLLGWQLGIRVTLGVQLLTFTREPVGKWFYALYLKLMNNCVR